MRLLKTAVFLFLSIISVDAFADWKTNPYQTSVKRFEGGRTFTVAQDVCDDFKSVFGSEASRCQIYDRFIYMDHLNTPVKIADFVAKKCPTAGTPLVAWLTKGTTHIPVRLCKDGCTFTGTGSVVEMTNYDNTILQATGDDKDCRNEYKDDPPPKCDKTDPYGDCYVPPDDNCVRAKDGSIFCPDNSKPPENNTCNGADYCKRPPEGCGPGYVPGSFNGEQLCVRSGPNVPKNPPDPDKPDDPNNCMNGGSYCPQPPDNTQCPSGYYETTYNGSKICVKNNPDPEKPNPNDPNTDGGGGASEPTGGGDGGGTGGSINLKPILDAITSLKNALLNALSGFHPKLDKIINGVNQGLEKLDKSNEHLDKIEDAAQATSEAVGESNKKLDGIKDAVESIGKCKNPNYDPTNLNSVKYFDCTSSDLGLTDSPFQIKEEQITDFQREDHIRFGQYCPYSRTVEDIGYFKFEKDLTFICEFGQEANPYIRAIGYLGALIYLLIALRSRE
ncbi:hypothetical protein [Acinetobacter sp. IK40]|jgi:hypothetical protein|uniref:hypothetical protein n=1 Tax=Acinetobacter sp. IK40 TaxID=2928897 RepID=UPI002D1EC77C|nr:hypothetical protein [Acinetobacter sp. IK40]MEB3790930.1 hypothetical protein [Acinetobacter sp. IK40]